MKFKILKLLIIFNFICMTYLFFNFSLIPYIQLNIYYKYLLNESLFIKDNMILSNINTPAMIDICKDIMNKTDVHSNLININDINKIISSIKTNITNCQSKLLSRGESTDFAVMGKVYSYLFYITHQNLYKEQAEYYIFHSKSLSPKREDLQRINSISATYLSKFESP